MDQTLPTTLLPLKLGVTSSCYRARHFILGRKVCINKGDDSCVADVGQELAEREGEKKITRQIERDLQSNHEFAPSRISFNFREKKQNDAKIVLI